MKTNFTITENSAILFEGHLLDIHNNFDHSGITNTEGKLRIEFVKSINNWIRNEPYYQLIFECFLVNYNFVQKGDTKALNEEKNTLAYISYFSSKLRNINTGLQSKLKSNKSDDIIFCFEDGGIIRIGCQEINLIAVK
jgi:hypothetical protein